MKYQQIHKQIVRVMTPFSVIRKRTDLQIRTFNNIKEAEKWIREIETKNPLKERVKIDQL
jgi:hypothetical protein